MRVAGAALIGLAGLIITAAGPAGATEGPAYSPIQSDREIQFVSQDLGLDERIKEIAAGIGHDPRIDYAMVDLDADGEGEVFIRIFEGEACQPGGCTTYVFSQSQGEWAKVLETTEVEVTVAKQMHKGYRDIIVASQPWLWSGKAYRASH